MDGPLLTKGELMEEKLQTWAKKYKLDNLRLIGFQGGYPMIEFLKKEESVWEHLKESKLNKIIRQAEMSAGMELGVGINFRKTAFVLINNETIVICGHELIMEKILNKVFLKNIR